MAANSLSHSSKRTAHSARSRVRLLLLVVIVAAVVDDEFDIVVSMDVYGRLSFDIESNELLLDGGFMLRTVGFGEPMKVLKIFLFYISHFVGDNTLHLLQSGCRSMHKMRPIYTWTKSKNKLIK